MTRTTRPGVGLFGTLHRSGALCSTCGERPGSAADLLATIYHQSGIDPGTMLRGRVIGNDGEHQDQPGSISTAKPPSGRGIPSPICSSLSSAATKYAHVNGAADDLTARQPSAGRTRFRRRCTRRACRYDRITGRFVRPKSRSQIMWAPHDVCRQFAYNVVTLSVNVCQACRPVTLS
jgi:hypothetical protein